MTGSPSPTGKIRTWFRASALSKDQDKVFKKQQSQPGRISGPAPFAAMIDIDCYQTDPGSVEPEDFVRTSIVESRRRIESALTKKKSGSA